MPMTTTERTECTTKLGRCHDCAQGILAPVHTGFSLYRNDEGQDEFWYCLYCGSNHVDLLDEEGSVIASQGNLYE
jgi:hypothetical protein